MVRQLSDMHMVIEEICHCQADTLTTIQLMDNFIDRNKMGHFKSVQDAKDALEIIKHMKEDVIDLLTVKPMNDKAWM